jgi:hypothetical protein
VRMKVRTRTRARQREEEEKKRKEYDSKVLQKSHGDIVIREEKNVFLFFVFFNTCNSSIDEISRKDPVNSRIQTEFVNKIVQISI